MHVPPVRRRLAQGLQLLLAAAWLWAASAGSLRAQGVELAALSLVRADGVLSLDFSARVALSKPVEDALQRGVPVYFVAQAELYRNRWYWRDERLARLTRSWRIAYQPLTSTWRVRLGNLSQSHATLSEALTSASRSAGWKLADLAQIDPDSRYYVEFVYRLDTSQLPSPMQFGLGGQGGDWSIGVERLLRVE